MHGSIKEDARTPDTVVPTSRSLYHRSDVSCRHSSRPSPVFGSGDGVFRPHLVGKYPCYSNDSFPLPDRSPICSQHEQLGYTLRRVQPSQNCFPPVDATRILASSFIPERMQHSIMEAPDHSDPVVIPASGQPSRPGPAIRNREGVFQPATPGEYLDSAASAMPDTPSFSRSVCQSVIGQNPAASVQTSAVGTLSIYYQNVGGINSCLMDYYLACSGNAYDVIVFVETWLDDRTQSSQAFGSEYEVFRGDRSPLTSRKTTGGGVAIAVRRCMNASKLDNSRWTGVEQVWVSIPTLSRKLWICAVYIPPDRIRDTILIDEHVLSVTSVVSSSSPVDDIVVLGDFNLPHVKWRPHRDGFMRVDTSESALSVNTSTLLDSYSAATLRQINPVENENGHMLDLCFVSHRDYAPAISVAPAPLVKHVRFHPPLLLSLSVISSTAFTSTSVPARYNFYKADVNSISEVLSSIDWENLLDKFDVDIAVQTFSNILAYVIDRHVPKQPSYDDRAPWMTKQLKRLKTAKRAALSQYSKVRARRQSNHVVLPLREHYSRLNQEYKFQSRRCYARYQRQIQQKLKTNPKAFWKFINDQRKEFGLPASMFYQNETTTDADEICRLFAQKFSSVYDNATLSSEQVSFAAMNVPLHGSSLNRFNFDDADILLAVAKLKSSVSTGPDGIPSILLKKCAQPLLVPLRHLFRLSLSTGKVPILWKSAYLFPVHKKGDKANIDNYRGVSALCAVSKLFELIVLKPMLFHLKNIISDDQHGFVSGKSTATNLLELTSYVMDGFADGCQTDVIYTDLSAAFDKLSHEIAIAKLERMGISGTLLTWFRSYLVGRVNCIKVGERLSPSFAPPSGIAQGSHLGPLVYVAYSNDCNHSLEGPRLSYADDLKIFLRITSTEDARSLQRQLNIFATWCESNRMVLNPTKCSVITFSRKKDLIAFGYRLADVILPREDCVKDLGVLLDSKLSFNQHISYIVTKASRQLGFIFRTTKSFTDVYCLKALYCGLVRSTLEYCSAVWHPYYRNGTDRIEGVQRRFIRYALRLLPWRNPMSLPSYISRCQLINIDTLAVRRNVTQATVVADLLASRINCPSLLQRINLLAPLRPLRNHAFLWLPIRRTNYSMHGAITGLQRVFNRVASLFDFNLSRDCLKKKFLMFFRR